MTKTAAVVLNDLLSILIVKHKDMDTEA